MRFLLLLLTCAVFLALAVPVTADEKKAPDYFVYLGTAAGGESKGIYLCELRGAEGGKLLSRGLAGEARNPNFLAIHPSGKFLYAVGEVAEFKKQKAGGVMAFAIDRKSGKLTLLNAQSSKGAGPCHIVTDAAGKYVLVANYGGGNVACLPIAADGKLDQATGFAQHEGKSVNPKRQEAPHAHSINLDPKNRFAFAADLGLDKIMIYRFDRDKGTLTPNDPPFARVPAGGGPRHFAFHPSGKFAYTNNELTMTVTGFTYDAQRGALEPLQTISTLPEGADHKGVSTAEVVVHPNGKFLYCSNRGHDTIAIFRIGEDGKLTAAGHQSTLGKTPRNFALDPTGRYLLAANQGSSTVVVFAVDQTTGGLRQVGEPVSVPNPVCVRFLAMTD